MSRRRAIISAIASYLPATRVANEELVRGWPAWSAERVRRVTGIRERAVAADTECASDLGIAAAEMLFANGSCRPGDVDFLIFCTQSPDFLIPSSACTMQHRLGLSARCGAFDMNQGCSGFVYALATAKSLVESSCANVVLLITADTYSKIIRPGDAPTRILFGDGAAATLVTAADDETEWIGPFVFGTDGSGARDIIVAVGGLRNGSVANVADRYLSMDGVKVFNFITSKIPGVVGDLLDAAGLTREQVDYFVFHQASKVILEHVRDLAAIPPERFCVQLETSGNTGSATIPACLRSSVDAGAIRRGDRVMLMGYGAGYSWGGAMIRNALSA